MRLTIYYLLFTLAAAGASPATDADDGPGPSDVTVVKSSWKSYVLREGWDSSEQRPPIDAARDEQRRRQEEAQRRAAKDKRPPLRNQPEHMPDIKRDPPAGVVKEYQYLVTVKNVGAKAIKSIAWDYLFVDTEEDKEVARHSFVSGKKIKPGETKELSGISVSPPTHVVGARTADTKSGFAERAVISKIEYTDGTVWQRP